MRRTMLFLAATLLAGTLPMMGSVSPLPTNGRSIDELEQRLSAIDSELEQLADYNLRGGVGSVGYRSGAGSDPKTQQSIRIELGEATMIDQVVLVPTIWREIKTGLRADGFPKAFRVVAGTSGDTTGTVIAHCDNTDPLLPRIAPMVIDCTPTMASWVTLEATALNTRIWDDRYVLQLAEMMVFSGEDNVALRKDLHVSTHGIWMGSGRDHHFLVDGFIPYLMNSGKGKQSRAYLSKVGIGDRPSLTIDLGQASPVNRIHLHTSDLNDTIPQAVADGFGVPRQLQVEGANQPDFSDAVELLEYRMHSIYETGPIIMLNFAETKCRYIRFTAIEPFFEQFEVETGTRLAFAEIEIFANGRNAALGRPVTSNFQTLPSDPNGRRNLDRMTDGRNFYGQILPLRQWMSELNRRHDLEAERPIVETALHQRYEKQKANLRRMSWLAVLLVCGIVFTILIDRMLRQRVIYQTRERIAANLHDELGANLYAIGLLGDLANGEMDSSGKSEDLADLIHEIRAVSKKTATAARYCTNMLGTPGLYEDLAKEMKRISNRTLADFKHDITFQGEEVLMTLTRRTRIDLFLFYQECLTNIIRHSGATQVSTKMTATKKTVHLAVADNGCGLFTDDPNQIPASLKRRAHLLGAHLSVEQNNDGGTTIHLTYRPRKLRLRKIWKLT